MPFLSGPLAVKLDIAVTIFVRYVRALVRGLVRASVRALARACVRPSGFVRVITSSFMHGFQSKLAPLLFLWMRSAI